MTTLDDGQTHPTPHPDNCMDDSAENRTQDRAESQTDERTAEVVPLHPDDPQHAGTDAGIDLEAAADVPLEDRDAARLPIVPEQLRRDRIGDTVREAAGLRLYLACYYGLRSPWYAVKTAWYALRGVFVLAGRLMSWWQWTHGWVLESQAVAAGRSGHHDAMNAHREGKRTRAARGRIVAAGTVAALAVLLVMVRFLPWWGWVLAGLIGVRVLAQHGAPEGRPIIRAALVPATYQPPTPEVITRGFASLNIKAINQVIKDGPGLAFLSDPHRDGPGWSVEIDLPHGVTARHIIQKREELASGLRRPHTATWPEAVPHEHPGRLYLWIGRHDLSKTKPAPYPLLRTGTTDIFEQVPFATTPRGQLVGAPLFETNYVVGAAPGQGKTNGLRVIGAGVALDPIADLWIHELSGKGDLEPLAPVCHRFCFGTDDEAIDYAAASVRKLHAELRRRQQVFKKLPRQAKPDGNLSRELAAQRHLRLRPIVAMFDEAHNLFLSQHGSMAAELLADVQREGRAVGIILILATQRPDKESLPPIITSLATVRICLMVNDQVSNDMILGTGAYKAGYRASEFRRGTDAGLMWVKGMGDTQALRSHYLDLNDTAKIAARARALRQAAGTLSGYALGETSTQETRSFAADVLSVFGSDDKLHCATIAARLSEHLPGVYADITREAVASQLRQLGVTVKDVREAGGTNRKGCERGDVEAVAGIGEAADV